MAAVADEPYSDKPTDPETYIGAVAEVNTTPNPQPESKRYSKILFYDNDQKHIDEIRSTGLTEYVTAVKVPSKKKLEEIPFERIPNTKENFYVEGMKFYTFSSDLYDSDSGLRITKSMDSDLKEFRKWISRIRDRSQAIVLFDWDRTITKVEGFYAPVDNFIDYYETTIPGYIEHMLRYLLEGENRVSAFRQFIEEITKAGIDIGILTNNSTFQRLDPVLKKLFGPSIPFKLYGSSVEPYYGDKGRYIRDNILNVNVRGGRRKTRRVTRRRRK